MQFQYLSPSTLNEATALLARYEGKARVIAGGTDLFILLNKREIRPEYVIDLEGIIGLNLIKYDRQKGLYLGPLTTIRSLEKSQQLQRHFPVLSMAAGNLGSVAIRNIATVGGNLCNALPSAEMAPTLIGLSTRLVLTSTVRNRTVLLEDFFTGSCQTILQSDEILTEIQVPLATNTSGVYFKYSPRGTIDPAVVNLALIITYEKDKATCQEARIVMGAVGPTPMRAKKAEDILRGEKISPSLTIKCGEAAAKAAQPRTSPEYKREIIRVLVKRALETIQNTDYGNKIQTEPEA